MSYLRFFAPQSSSQRIAGQSVFGGISGIPDSSPPAIRIAALALTGEESEAMGIIVALRHLLNTHADLAVIPAYYQLDAVQALAYGAGYSPFVELKNQLSLRGDYRNDGTLTIHLEGLLMREGRASWHLQIERASQGESLLKLASEIAAALGVEPSQEWSALEPTLLPLASLWDLEDRLLGSVTEESLDEAALVEEFREILAQAAPSSLGSYILGHWAQDAATGPYSLSNGTLLALLEAAAKAANDTLLVPLMKGLIMHGRSDMVVDMLLESIDARSEAVRLLFADAAVYSGHLGHAVRTLQTMLSQQPSHAVARAYADTVRYLFETQRFEPSMPLVFSQTEDIVEEIIEAYRYAYELDAVSETGLRLLDFQIAVEADLDGDVVVSIVAADSAGVECQNLISTLSENEYLELAIEAIEALETLTDNHLLGLALLYAEINDYEAAKECLDDVTDHTTTYYKQVAYQVLVPDADKLIYDMAQRLAAGHPLSDEQIEVLESIVAIYDAHEAAYLVLARAYAAQDDLEAAVDVLNEAAERINSPNVFLQKYQLYWERERHDEAINALLDGAAQHPQDAAIYAQLARCFFDLDRPDESREFLRKADFLAPDSPLVTQVKNYIGANLARE